MLLSLLLNTLSHMEGFNFLYATGKQPEESSIHKDHSALKKTIWSYICI